MDFIDENPLLIKRLTGGIMYLSGGSCQVPATVTPGKFPSEMYLSGGSCQVPATNKQDSIEIECT